MKFTFIIFLLLLVLSCSDENVIEDQCVSTFNTDDWQAELFKTDYTIRFPDNYMGLGMVGFEGHIFQKMRVDSSVVIEYGYCGPLWCDDFGDTLASEIPDTLVYERPNDTDFLLTDWIYICNDISNEAGILYFDETEPVHAIYFMNINDVFLESASITYSTENFEEVRSILGTIEFTITIY